MTSPDQAPPLGGRPHYWQSIDPGQSPPGDELAALRSGVDREAGTVPALWPYYTTLTEDGRRTPALVAEHLALTLFGVHQQSQRQRMHRDGVGFGTAVLALRHHGKFSADAVDRRFGAAATATTLGELGVHLRGLITQLRSIDQPLDYTRLARDLRDWQSPLAAGRVRRRWGGQYFAPARPNKTKPGDNPTDDRNDAKEEL